MGVHNDDFIIYAAFILIMMVSVIISIFRFILPKQYQFIKYHYFNFKVWILILAIIIINITIDYHHLSSEGAFIGNRFKRDIFFAYERNKIIKKIIAPYLLWFPLGNMVSNLFFYIIKKIKK